MARFLSKDKLEGFEKYRYNSIDTSILSNYVMHPFWNWCVQFCPVWVAPNLLTFSGFLLTVLNFLLFSYYDYGFHALTKENKTNDNIPNWVWAVTAVNLFVAYTLDGIDGKQARRTGSSGPLGELFDHGLDSYSTVLIPTCLYSIFGRDELSPLRFFFVIWNIFLNFYLTHWEKYNTGVMFLPWGYDFTMLGSCALLLVTSLTGPLAWHAALPGGLTPGVVFEFVLYFSAIITSQTIILWNIYKSYRDRTGKMRPIPEAVRPLVPLAIFFVLSAAWASRSPNDIITRGPRLFYILTGTIFSNINCRLIVSQMSDTRCEWFNGLLVPYALVVAAACWGVSPATEERLLGLLTALASLAHLRYGTGVVRPAYVVGITASVPDEPTTIVTIKTPPHLDDVEPGPGTKGAGDHCRGWRPLRGPGSTAPARDYRGALRLLRRDVTVRSVVSLSFAPSCRYHSLRHVVTVRSIVSLSFVQSCRYCSAPRPPAGPAIQVQ